MEAVAEMYMAIKNSPFARKEPRPTDSDVAITPLDRIPSNLLKHLLDSRTFVICCTTPQTKTFAYQIVPQFPQKCRVPKCTQRRGIRLVRSLISVVRRLQYPMVRGSLQKAENTPSPTYMRLGQKPRNTSPAESVLIQRLVN